ncbi:MLO protein homolog 1-like [Camellia sinensis]|uniref:MLO protein homolog 1-like n=1 Tax=Camellia sinensis TaxID=4442 RepID=UPI0010358648|nr:MLO protein homolog 1-like [Camellia sinensis]
MVAGANGVRSLRETPTWAVALVSAVFVIISVLIEHGIHSLEKWFRKLQKKAMIEALEKIKAGESVVDISVRGAPIAHFHICACHFPCSV